MERERNFYTVVDKLLGELPSELADNLLTNLLFWKEEVKWIQLSRWIHSNVNPNSSDEMSVKIYSIVTDRTNEETRALFQNNGL